MKTLLTALLIVFAGLALYLYLTRGDAVYQVGPTQKELDAFKVDSKRKTDSLTRSTQILISERQRDSTVRANENRQSRKVIKSLKDRADSLLAAITDTTPCCEASEIKSRVIALKATVIEKQEGRIKNDSIFIANLKGNFEYQIKNEVAEKDILRDGLTLANARIAALEAELKKKNTGGWIKSGVIVGLIVLLTQTVD